MSLEYDATQAAAMLGYSREYYVKCVTKRPDHPKPSQNCSPKKRKWRVVELQRFKEGKR